MVKESRFKGFPKFSPGDLALVTKGRIILYADAEKKIHRRPALEPGDYVLMLTVPAELGALISACTSRGVVYFDKAYTLWLQPILKHDEQNVLRDETV